MMISVIIPVYNVDKYLSRCIESVLREKKCEYEIILVDDGSTDTSPEICDAYKEKYPDIITVIHKRNEGLGFARNSGMEVAKGEYYFFLDSDDWIPVGTLEYLSELQKKEKIDIISFRFRMVHDEKQYNDSIQGTDKYIKLTDKKSIIEKYLSREILDTAWTKLYSRRIFEKTKFTDIKIYEDSYSMHEFLYQADSLIILDKICYMQYVRENSLFQSQMQDKNFLILDCGMRLLEFVKEHNYDDLIDLTEGRVLEKKLFLANKIIFDGAYTKYKSEFWKLVNDIHEAVKVIPIENIGKIYDRDYRYIRRGKLFYFIMMNLYCFYKRQKFRIMDK